MPLVAITRIVADLAGRSPARRVARREHDPPIDADLPFETATGSWEVDEPAGPCCAPAEHLRIEKDCRRLLRRPDFDRDSLGRDLPADFEGAALERPEVHHVPLDALRSGISRAEERDPAQGEKGR